MSVFIVPTHLRDVAHIRTLTGSDFEKVSICCSGIEICEQLLALGAKNVSFHEIQWETLRGLSQLPETSNLIARSFDARHAELRSKYLGIEVENLGWDYLNIYFIAESVLSVRCAFLPFIDKLPVDGSPIFLNTTNSQDFYFDSSLIRGVVKKAISIRFKDFLEVNIPPWEIFQKDANSFTLEIPKGSYRVLSHLPTVFYSAAMHKERLGREAADQLLDLQSPYFDIPMSRHRVRLGPGQMAEVPRGFAEYWRDYEMLLSDFYSTLDLSEEARSSGMFERHRGWAISQYCAYKSMEAAEAFKQIERVEISCHDTGLAGPLISWANKREIPVHMWPHSEVINVVTPVLRKGQKHSYVEGETLPLELGVGKSNWVDQKKRHLTTRVCGKTVLILMNQLDKSWYVPNCQVLGLREALQAFIQRLSAEGWEVKLRQKPSHAYHVLLSFEGAQCASGPLENLFGWPAFCISVGSPTTAMIGFWKNGSHCLHLQEATLSLMERFIVPAGDVDVFHSDRFSSLFERAFNQISKISGSDERN